MPAYSEYTATTKSNLVITIQCEACDHVFMIEQTEVGEGKASTQWSGPEAKMKAEREAKTNLQNKISNIRWGKGGVTERKCPGCGYLQSYMIKDRRKGAILALIFGIFFSAFAISLSLESVSGFTFDPKEEFFWGIIIMLSIVAFFAVLCLGISMYMFFVHPNREWFKKAGKKVKQAPAPRKPLKVEEIPIVDPLRNLLFPF